MCVTELGDSDPGEPAQLPRGGLPPCVTPHWPPAAPVHSPLSSYSDGFRKHLKELHCSTCNKIQPPGRAHGAWVIAEPSPAGPHAAPPWLSMASSRAALTLPPSPNEPVQLLPASGPLHLAVPSTFHIPEPLRPSVLSLNVCPPERSFSHSLAPCCSITTPGFSLLWYLPYSGIA